MISKSLACKKLGIDKDKLLSVPQVTPLLTEILSGLKKRNLPTDPYYYLDSSGDSDPRTPMLVYRFAWKQVRDVLPLEAFCIAAGVDPNSILDSLVKAIERVK